MKLGLWIRVLICSLAVCATAHAQTPSITLNPSGVERTNQADRTLGLDVINRQDCLNDDTYVFSFQLLNTENFTIEAWRGNDCTNPDNRREGAVGCRKVAQGLSGTQMIVPVSNIVEGSLTATEAACDLEIGRDNAQEFTLFFLPVDIGGAIPEGAVVAQWPPADQPRALFDMIGPNAPTDVSAGAGDERIIVSYDASTATDVTGYRVYCDPPPGPTDTASGCGSTNLAAGEIPPDPESTFRCGNVGSMAETINASNLQNGIEYAIGVAALDRVGNVGPLSTIVCATPKPVTGFFEAYRAAGGTAGGGFCSISRRSSPAALGLVLAAGLVLSCRRRRAR